MNEIIFISYIAIVGSAAVAALLYGKEALITLICLEWVLANLFVTKQITLFGLEATASDALAVGATLAFNLLLEYHGRTISKRVIGLSFSVTMLYTLLSLLHLAYDPAPHDWAHPHFAILLTPMPRIIAASMTSYLAVQTLDYYLFTFLKRHTQLSLFLRNTISLSITQLVDTILFTFLGLYGLISPLLGILVVSYTIKLITIALLGPFAALSRYVYKKYS